MNTTDPIADMLTRIRNANMASLREVDVPSSKLKNELAKLLKTEGYIEDYKVEQKEGSAFKTLKITLKYDEKSKPVISNLKRVSKTIKTFSSKTLFSSLYFHNLVFFIFSHFLSTPFD